MEDDDLVLSDVHIVRGEHVLVGSVTFKPSNASNSRLIDVAVTRFPFTFPRDRDVSDIGTNTRSLTADDDGDLEVPRRRSTIDSCEVITIEHGLASPLPLVGLQVWLGALLLADYVVHLGRTLSVNRVLELGAGTGLCSIAAAMFAKRVICTDIGTDVLNICKRNVKKNEQLIKSKNPIHPKRVIRVRELDWRKEFPLTEKTVANARFRWSKEDLEVLNDCDIILAADVIYDDGITDCLFTLLSKLLRGHVRKTLYLSLERRLNFTLSSLDVACPAYDHFLEKIRELESSGITAKKVNVDFPQYFQYERSKYLELWIISFH